MWGLVLELPAVSASDLIVLNMNHDVARKRKPLLYQKLTLQEKRWQSVMRHSKEGLLCGAKG